ncbi:MAG: DUF4097 family beta strand repeat-containing protein [Desulfobacterales bacterium]
MKYTAVLIFLLLPALVLAGTVQEIKQLDLSIQGIDGLVVSCGAGLLDLNGVEGRDKISVTAEIEVEDLQKEDLQKFIEKNVRLNLEKRNNKALLKSEVQKYAPVELEARINLMIEVPLELDVNIADGSGTIRVQNLVGNLKIDDDTGKIQVENIFGKVIVNDASGKIDIEDIRGSVMVRDGSGPIQIDHINGDVYVTDGSGDMTILHVDGNVTVSDDSGDIDISDVSRAVFISAAGSGELNIERVKGKNTTRE